MQQGQWTEAVGYWQGIRHACEPTDKIKRTRSWHWWQAKYYELFCYSRLPQVTKEDLTHAVQVLGALYDDIPDCWNRKLAALSSI